MHTSNKRRTEEKKMIIKLWDNEGCEYPRIEIQDNSIKHFEKLLKKHQKKDAYTYDDFAIELRKKKYFKREILYDKKMFF